MPKNVPESTMCKRGCCWNSMQVCGRAYKCRCHHDRAETHYGAQIRLEDYLDSLGDDV